MLGIQPIHIVIIVVVALLIFGPKRLPEMGRSIGRAINEFRNGTQDVTDSLRADFNASAAPGPANTTVVPGTPSPTPAQSVPFQPAAIAPAPGGKFCIHCGASNLPEGRFCNNCGQPLPENTIKPADPSSLDQPI